MRNNSKTLTFYTSRNENKKTMVLKILHVILLASIKYVLTIPYARLIGLTYEQALIAVLIGGIGGFLFFFYLSGWVIKGIKSIWPFVCRLIPSFYQAKYKGYCGQRKKTKTHRIFTKKSRFIVSLHKSYGLWGIVIATPILLTIPLGAFLANKYYAGRKYVVTYMILSIIGWAFVLTTFIQIFPGIIK